MSLLYFDGFDTYGVVPESTATIGTDGTPALTAAGWTVSTVSSYQQTIGRPSAAEVAEPRNWLTMGVYTAGSPPQTTTVIAPRYQRNLPTTNGKVVVGFKVFAAGGFYSTSTSWHFMARVINGAHLVDLYIYNGSTPLYRNNIAMVTSSGQTTVANILDRAALTVLPPPAESLVTNSSYVAQGAVNTIEVELDTVNNSATLWVNNIFAKTVEALPLPLLSVESGNAQPATLVLGEGVPTTSSAYRPKWFYTDIYAVDGAGDTMNSRLGKVRVHTRMPTADVQAELSRPAEASSNAQVAGQIPPSSNNFLTGVNVDDTDLYSSNPFEFSNEAILATAVSVSAYKTDPAGNDLAPVIKIGETTHELSTLELPVGTTYGTQLAIVEKNPETGLPFTKNALDSTAFGVRVKAPTT